MCACVRGGGGGGGGGGGAAVCVFAPPVTDKPPRHWVAEQFMTVRARILETLRVCVCVYEQGRAEQLILAV